MIFKDRRVHFEEGCILHSAHKWLKVILSFSHYFRAVLDIFIMIFYGNHCGLDLVQKHFTTKGAKPIDLLDFICYIHDLQYEEMGEGAYTNWNQADVQMYRSLLRYKPHHKKQRHFKKWFLFQLRVKRKFFPHHALLIQQKEIMLQTQHEQNLNAEYKRLNDKVIYGSMMRKLKMQMKRPPKYVKTHVIMDNDGYEPMTLEDINPFESPGTKVARLKRKVHQYLVGREKRIRRYGISDVIDALDMRENDKPDTIMQEDTNGTMVPYGYNFNEILKPILKSKLIYLN